MHLRHEILLNYTLILVSNKWGIQLLGHKDGTRTQEFMKFQVYHSIDYKSSNFNVKL